VQRNGFEIVLPGIRDGGVAGVGQHDRRARRRKQREKLQAGGHLRRLREQAADLVGPHGPHIGDLALAEGGEFGRVELEGDIVLVHGALLRASGVVTPLSDGPWLLRRLPLSPQRPRGLKLSAGG
jgi:hypothetical protein